MSVVDPPGPPPVPAVPTIAWTVPSAVAKVPSAAPSAAATAARAGVPCTPGGLVHEEQELGQPLGYILARLALESWARVQQRGINAMLLGQAAITG